MIDDLGEENINEAIPIPNVGSEVLKKVIAWCEHQEHGRRSIDVTEWDRKFLGAMELDTLFGLILAANYLEITPLLAVACEKVAKKIGGQSPERVREILNIQGDLTAEEEGRIRRELKCYHL